MIEGYGIRQYSWLRRYWRLLVPIVALAGLSIYVGFGRLLEILTTTDLERFLFYCFGIAILPILLGVQVATLFRIRSVRVELRTAIAATMHAWSIGTLTPARTGDISLVHFLKCSVPAPMTLSALVTDRLVTLVFLGMAGLISCIYIENKVAVPFALSCAALLVVLLLLITSIIFTNHVSKVAQWGSRITGNLPVEALKDVRRNFRSSKYLLTLGIFVSIRWSFMFLLNQILFSAVQVELSLTLIIAGTTAGRIISLVPISFWGIGLKEPFQILIYAPAGILAAQVVAVSVLGLAGNFLIAAVLPLLVLSNKHVTEESHSE